MMREKKHILCDFFLEKTFAKKKTQKFFSKNPDGVNIVGGCLAARSLFFNELLFLFFHRG